MTGLARQRGNTEEREQGREKAKRERERAKHRIKTGRIEGSDSCRRCWELYLSHTVGLALPATWLPDETDNNNCETHPHPRLCLENPQSKDLYVVVLFYNKC